MSAQNAVVLTEGLMGRDVSIHGEMAEEIFVTTIGSQYHQSKNLIRDGKRKRENQYY